MANIDSFCHNRYPYSIEYLEVWYHDDAEHFAP